MSLPESFRDFQCPIRMFVTNLDPNSELCTPQLGSRFVDRSGSKMHILHRPNVSQPHRKGVDIICNILRSCGAVRPEFETYKRGREIKRLFKEASRESKRLVFPHLSERCPCPPGLLHSIQQNGLCSGSIF